MDPLIRGSVTHLTAGDRGRHVLVGSHGGLYTAVTAASIGVASLICHDAGIGFEEAGVKGLQFLEAKSIPAAAVDFRSARVGDAADMLARGSISRVNDAGAACGVELGMAVAETLEKFQASEQRPPPDGLPTFEKYSEGRYLIAVASAHGERCDALAVDSASLVRPTDAGMITITGSHGGLPGGVGKNAIKAPVRCAVFNDAGVGIDRAGIGRLPVLETLGIAGLTVAARSARIGEALSTYETGVISHVNRPARNLGAQPGQSVHDFVDYLVSQSFSKELM